MANINSWLASSASRNRASKERFFRLALEMFPHFDFSKFEWVNSTTKGIVICPAHGEILKRPSDLTSGYGCALCRDQNGARKRQTKLEDVIAKFSEVHGDRYDYSLVTQPKNNKTNVNVICKKHGVFSVQVLNHTQGQNCGKCTEPESKGERAIAAWLESKGEVVAARTRKLIPPYEIDVYLPERNLAIEYCGIYWHSDLSDPKRDIEDRHYRKYKLCQELGIQLITIFETEWIKKFDLVLDMLGNRLGYSAQKFQARKCSVVRGGLDYDAFYKANHIQGPPRGGLTYGLIYNQAPVAMMTFSKATSHRGLKSRWELVRFASVGNVVGGASRLFRAFIRDETPGSVVSYSDNRFFSGNMYQKLGFEFDGDSPPSYSVIIPGRRILRHKSNFRRKNLPKIIAQYKLDDVFDPETDPRSEGEFCKQHGFGRIYDCGKKRWLWTAK